LEKALETKYITEKELKTLSEWNNNPSEWDVN
jgi:orotate phosphoribosyltransferase